MYQQYFASATSSHENGTQNARFKKMMCFPENLVCFECGAKRPTWASTNLGIFFCLRCAGIHRALGTHITKVKSINMDTWDESAIDFIERIGNARGRILYEHNMPDIFKPNINTSSNEFEKLLRIKYEKKAYYHPNHEELLKKFINSDIEARVTRSNDGNKLLKTSNTTEPITTGEAKESASPNSQPSPKENLFEPAEAVVPIPSLFCKPVVPTTSSVTSTSNSQMSEHRRHAEVLDLFADANRAPPSAKNVWSGNPIVAQGHLPTPSAPASSMHLSVNGFHPGIGGGVSPAPSSYTAPMWNTTGPALLAKAPLMAGPTSLPPFSGPQWGGQGPGGHGHHYVSPTPAMAPLPGSVGCTKDLVQSLFATPSDPSEAVHGAWKPRRAGTFYSPHTPY
ncbi:unnamed protein product [Phytomonas sp. EM1]|nr:unnamed protein product [Phytomonas sp. EM1]|eukprot:CCW62316.1 unnamed protein product [Phytomonas sp. isolate EM1]